MEHYQKTGYLQEAFRLFHLKDCTTREIDLHYHDFYKIIVFYGGNVTYMIEGKSYVLEPGDVILVNRGDIHKPTVDFSQPYERSIFYVSAEYLERCRTAFYDPFFCFLQAAEKKSYVLRCRAFFETEAGRILAEMEQKKSGYGTNERQALLFQLFLLSFNRICKGEDGDGMERADSIYHKKIGELLTYIKEHLFEELSVEELSARFYVSKYHMMRQFKKETGYTIHKYITEKRIAAAKEKLLAGVPAAKVSEECGFMDYSTFLRAFQSCVHMPPTEFVRSYQARWSGGEHRLL